MTEGLTLLNKETKGSKHIVVRHGDVREASASMYLKVP